jgi:hypothetical protein
MTNRLDASRLQPTLIAVALVAALIAAAALLLSGQAARQQSHLRGHAATLAALSQNIPLQAGAAVRGSAPAFDALAESRESLARLLDDPAAQLPGGRDGWSTLLEQTQAVLDGREAALDAQQAAASVRELTPQLLAAAANVAKAVGPARAESLAPHFERFELRAQAVEQDLSALADGTAPVETAARRLSDSLVFMGQLVSALNGEDNALGIAGLP